MHARSADFERLLRTLLAHDVAFLVVGGASAVLQGAPMPTLDLDIVHERSQANVDRLISALVELDACYREHLPSKLLRPAASGLMGPGHHLLMTKAGPLDVLGVIGAQRDHASLFTGSEAIALAGLRVRVLDLPTLIRVKEESGRAKDAQALPLLRAVLAERKRREE